MQQITHFEFTPYENTAEVDWDGVMYKITYDEEGYSVFSQSGERLENYPHLDKAVCSEFFGIFRSVTGFMYESCSSGYNVLNELEDFEITYEEDGDVLKAEATFLYLGEPMSAVSIRDYSNGDLAVNHALIDSEGTVVDSFDYLAYVIRSRFYPVFALLDTRISEEVAKNG